MRMKALKLSCNINLDHCLMAISLMYILVPIIIFLFGWIRPIFAVVLSACVLFFLFKVYKYLSCNMIKIIDKESRTYWFIVFICICFWVYLSGIGSFTYQNLDFWARNPIYRDLCDYSWPVVYNLSEQASGVQDILGNDSVAFAYYFSWWLPPAFITKIFSFGELERNICLYIWAVLGVFLIVYNIGRYLKKNSYVIPGFFIFFSGLDAVGKYLVDHGFALTDHIEWWARYFQYSSNTSLLFWVFNQTIPIWLIVILLLQIKDTNSTLGVASLAFAYSPWATIGIIPIAVSTVISKSESIKKKITLQNIVIPLIMLIVYGSFYSASSGSSYGESGLIFLLYPNEKRQILLGYLMFIVLEFGIYFVLIGKSVRRDKYYYVILGELLIMPLCRYLRGGNFAMRASIPALFILMLYIMEFLMEKNVGMQIRKKILIIVLIIGSLTPLTEINRSIYNTMNSSEILQEQVHSLGAIRTEDKYMIQTIKEQFFVYDYENSAFFKYLAK